MRAESFKEASELDKGHGRIERRTIETTTWLEGYLDWPGVRQVYRLRRTRTVGGVTVVEETYGITSLGPEKASPKRLLGWIRAHWGIENRLHGVRDWTLGEDACRVRSGNAPQVLAAIRNTALWLLRSKRKGNTAAAIRDLQFHREKALRLVARVDPE